MAEHPLKIGGVVNLGREICTAMSDQEADCPARHDLNLRGLKPARSHTPDGARNGRLSEGDGAAYPCGLRGPDGRRG
jgi:hypothetical protein